MDGGQTLARCRGSQSRSSQSQVTQLEAGPLPAYVTCNASIPGYMPWPTAPSGFNGIHYVPANDERNSSETGVSHHGRPDGAEWLTDAVPDYGRQVQYIAAGQGGQRIRASRHCRSRKGRSSTRSFLGFRLRSGYVVI